MQKARMIFAALTLALGAAAMSGCALLGLDAADELDPTPRIQTHASAIWNEYQKDNTRRFANDQYKNIWANVLLDGVRRDQNGDPAGIDAVAGQTVILRTPGQIGKMEFKFRFIEQAQELQRGDKPWVLCNISGTDLTRTAIRFAHCRPSEQTNLPIRN